MAGQPQLSQVWEDEVALGSAEAILLFGTAVLKARSPSLASEAACCVETAGDMMVRGLAVEDVKSWCLW